MHFFFIFWLLFLGCLFVYTGILSLVYHHAQLRRFRDWADHQTATREAPPPAPASRRSIWGHGTNSQGLPETTHPISHFCSKKSTGILSIFLYPSESFQRVPVWLKFNLRKYLHPAPRLEPKALPETPRRFCQNWYSNRAPNCVRPRARTSLGHVSGKSLT